MRKQTTKALIATALSTTLGFASAAQAGHTNHVLDAKLSGSEMVGSMGDSDGKGYAHVFGIDGDPTTLCYVVQVHNIQTVPAKEGMAAHIHQAGHDRKSGA